MKKMEYEIVDIETNCGNVRVIRITEIVIVIYKGHEVIERYETLVN